jgi:hypothetical protein
VEELEEENRLANLAIDEIMTWVEGSAKRLGRGGSNWRGYCRAIVHNLREKGIVKGDVAALDGQEDGR